MADRDLIVHIIGDDRHFQQALTRSTRSTAAFESRFTRLNQSLRGGLAGSGVGARGSLLFGSGAFIGTAAITGAISKSVQAASDLNEQMAKVEEVFEESSGTIKDWSQTTAQALGISRREALASAGTFGNLFAAMGLGNKQSADLSKQLVTLAADLASFNNSNPTEALTALRSGLVGEIEPLRRFGADLNAARVQQIALANSGKKTVKELTNQDKVLARIAIIMKDTEKAQGDAARTSESFANQSRQLKANLDDLSASIGQTLVPTLAGALKVMNETVGGINNLIAAGGRLREFFQSDNTFDGFNKGVEDANTGLLGFMETVRDAIPGMERFLALRNQIVGGGDPEPPVIEQTGPQRGAGGRAAARAAREEAEREAARGQAAIDRIERAAAEKSLQQQLANSEKRAAHLRVLIRGDSDNVKLQQRLSAELAKQASLRNQITDAARRAADEDRRAREEAKQAAEDARQLARERAQAAAVARVNQRNARQFAQLGLTPDGQRPTPGAESLLSRTRSLQDQVRGTPLDTQQTRAQLQAIERVLVNNFRNTGQKVRAAILEMLNRISDALNGKASGGASVQTKFVKRGIGKLLDGLGLTPEQQKELEQRFAQQGPGGTVPGKGTAAFGFAVQPRSTSTSTRVPSEGVAMEFHIYIDGDPVEAVVTRKQQRNRGRNAASRRGTRPGL